MINVSRNLSSPFRLLSGIAAGALIVVAPTFAQPIAEDEVTGEIFELSPFTVSSETDDQYRATHAVSAVRIRAPLIDTASSISVVTRQMIDDIAPSRIFDVTRYVAGVQEGRGIQFQDRMIIRGFESNGQRTVDNFIQPNDADNINEAVVDRIEVTKGPNAILSPAGAPGGSINVLTKAPLYEEARSISAQIGLFDAQKIALDMGGPLGDGEDWAYRLVTSFQDSRRYWDEDARLRTKVVAPMFGYRFSDTTQLTVKAIVAEGWIFREPLLIIDPSVNADTDKPFLIPGVEAKSMNGIQDWSHVGTHTADLFAELTSTINENISVRVAANGRYYHEDSEQEFLSTPSLNNRYNPMTGVLTQNHVWQLDGESETYVPVFSPFYDPNAIPVRGDKQATRRKTGSFQSDIVARYNFGEVTSQTVAGFGYSHQDGMGRGRNGVLPPIDLDNLDVEVRPVYPDAYAFHNENEFTNWQLYINERLGFMEDRVQLAGGILRYDTKTESANVLTGAPPGILDDSKDMWMASILVKPLENLSLYFSRSTNASPVVANNLPLWREGEQDEVGFKSEWFDGRLALNGAYFDITQTNVTIPNPDRQTNPSAPEQLIADFGNHGWEVEMIGRITDNLSALATYSNLHMRDSLGRRVRGVADNNASALMSYRFADGGLDGLSLSFGVSYSGERAGDTPINFTPLGVVGQTSFFLEPSYATSASAAYTYRERYRFQLNIDNVLDDEGYISVAGGRVAGTGITTAPGINVKFKTTVSF